jgi:restriction system protein
MNPYAFGELIGKLLEAMGYRDVEVTQKSGDKGVDVLGTIEVGISNIKEVVQVKRYNSSRVGDPEVNQLRGTLSRFGAIRGTIITSGKFSKQAEEASLYGAPITLIDGQKLIELLIHYRIGVKEEQLAPILVFDATEFEASESQEE